MRFSRRGANMVSHSRLHRNCFYTPRKTVTLQACNRERKRYKEKTSRLILSLQASSRRRTVLIQRVLADACAAARMLDRPRDQGAHHRITSEPPHFWCTFSHSLSELPLFDGSGNGVAGEWARGVSVTSNGPPGHSSGRTNHGVWHDAKAAGARLLL